MCSGRTLTYMQHLESPTSVAGSLSEDTDRGHSDKAARGSLRQPECLRTFKFNNENILAIRP